MKISLKRLHFVLFPVLMLVACSGNATIRLTDKGKSPYRIVIPENPTVYERKAALELTSFISRISGASLPVVADTGILAPFEIILGNNRHLKLAGIRIGFDELGTDGYVIKEKGDHLAIAGGSEKGTLYGVFALLEMLGCRYYAPDMLYVPSNSSIVIEDPATKEVPCFEYREMLFPAALDSAYLMWHRLDRHRNGEWGMWVHTFDDLLPPQQYFSEHPEYFSEINGQRVPDGQLCLSRPEVLNLVVQNLEKKISANPDPLYWSVSQNDNYLACQCERCRELDRDYGGPSGTMIWFVNQVAEHFPDKVISTLAYQYTRQAPEKIKPAGNVNIMLCTIECNRSLPIAEDPSGKSFVNDLKDWSRLTGNILLWDYVVQFRNYVSPFPNFRVLQPNLQLFEKYGCEMMFQQGSGDHWSDFADLKAYLVAKLLWDPDADAEAVINDFIYGYYGNAAPYIRQYFDMLHDELFRSGKNLWIYGYPFDAVDSYLTPSLLREYENLFSQAEEAVEDRPEILARVKKVRLPLDFAILDISLHNYDDSLSYFSEEEGTWKVRQEMTGRLEDFITRANAQGIERLQEQGTSPGEYGNKVMDFIRKSQEPSLARSHRANLLTPFSPRYDAGGERALTDGLRGTDDYHFNWLGFQGEDMVAIIDLLEITEISRVSADFLQNSAAWIFLPVDVNVLFSTDSVNYSPFGRVVNIFPARWQGPVIHPFTIDASAPVPARYLKIEARSLKTCPGWHIGAGEKCWIFTDEVVVQ